MTDHAHPSFLSQPTSSAAAPNIFGGLASAGHMTLAELVVAAAAGLAETGELVSAVDSGSAAGLEEYEPPVDLADYAARRRAARPRRTGSRARCR
jgi:hypothetical protein